MKKLLASFALLPAVALAQTPEQNVATDRSAPVTIPSGTKTFDRTEAQPDHSMEDIQQLLSGRAKQDVVTFQLLGETRYDLQTNASVGRRIRVYDNGTISAVWTQGLDDNSNYSDRGTGYNHFNGNEWVRTANQISRLEDTRTGWPSIGSFGDVGGQGDDPYEFTLTHIAGDDTEGTGGFVFSENNEIGGLNFSNTVREGGDGPIWWRTATAGDNLYAIGNYSRNSDLGGDTVIQGIRFPTVYYRSTDRGQTFEDSAALLPGYADSSERLFGTADDYAIDARDSIVAIAMAESGRSIHLWKSTDSGRTWNKQTVRSLGISTERFRTGLWGIDTIENPNPNPGPGGGGDSVIVFTDTANDGSISTVVDEQGTVHLSWGNRVAYRNDSTLDPGVFRFSVVDNVIKYWNDEDEEVVDAGFSPTVAESDEGYTTGEGEAPYSTSASTRPMLSYKSADTMFIVYEAAVANTVRIRSDYRDLYVVYSTDGGSSWSQPQNFTKTAEQGGESVFASATKRTFNNQLHVVWQEDVAPGTAVGAQSVQGTVNDNSIYYASVSVDDILADTITRPGDTVSGLGTKRIPNAALSAYPNPARDGEVITAQLTLEQAADVTYKVVSTHGQVKYQQRLGRVSAGKRQWNIPADNLAKGVYILQVTVDDRVVSKKLIQQ